MLRSPYINRAGTKKPTNTIYFYDMLMDVLYEFTLHIQIIFWGFLYEIPSICMKTYLIKFFQTDFSWSYALSQNHMRLRECQRVTFNSCRIMGIFYSEIVIEVFFFKSR